MVQNVGGGNWITGNSVTARQYNMGARPGGKKKQSGDMPKMEDDTSTPKPKPSPSPDPKPEPEPDPAPAKEPFQVKVPDKPKEIDFSNIFRSSGSGGGYYSGGGGGSPDYQGPKSREVGENELVENRLAGILQKDSALMDRAKTEGLQTAASRGLLNSSMAAGEAQGAMIDRATPIAQQDAETYARQGLANQKYTNQFRSEGNERSFMGSENAKDRQHSMSMLNREIAGQKDLFSMEAKFTAERDRTMREFEARESALDRQFSGSENEADRQSRKNELARQAATELMRQTSGQNASFMDAVSQVQSSDMSAEGKQNAVDNMIDMHYNNLNTTSALSDYDIVNGKVVYNERPQHETEGSQMEGMSEEEYGPENPFRPGYESEGNYGLWRDAYLYGKGGASNYGTAE